MIHHFPLGDADIIVAPGRFDEWAAREVRDMTARLVEQGSRMVVFDLTGTEYIGAHGQGVLIGAKWRLDDYGEHPAVVIAADQKCVIGPMRESGLIEHLNVYGSVEDAIAGLTGTVEGTSHAA